LNHLIVSAQQQLTKAARCTVCAASVYARRLAQLKRTDFGVALGIRFTTNCWRQRHTSFIHSDVPDGLEVGKQRLSTRVAFPFAARSYERAPPPLLRPLIGPLWGRVAMTSCIDVNVRCPI